MSDKTDVKKDVTGSAEVSATTESNIDYGHGVIVLPRAAAERFGTATKKDIMALMYCLAAAQGWSVEEAAAAFGTAAADDPASALSFWRGAGVISGPVGASDTPDRGGSAAKTDKPRRLKKPEASLPSYTTDELSEILERRAGSAAVIDECERMLGKMFSTSETAKVVGLMDYLGLDGEYIINLCAHCARIGRRSLRYVETTAFDLYDRGITDVEALDEHLRVIEESAKLEGKIRAMFGMDRARALTARERGFIDSWVGKFGYGLDIIGKAYEITVDSTGKASLPYANAILEAWNAAGLKTATDIDAYIASKNASDDKKTVPEGTSFNTDDFFEAALRRSYGTDEIPDIPSSTGTPARKQKK